MHEYKCSICQEPYDAFFNWTGPPFSSRKIIELCSYCGHVMKPQVQDDIEVIGTFTGEMYSMSEMLEEGFKDKNRIKKSLNAVGKVLEYKPTAIKELIKS